ncbi:DUF2804 domain-containing protein [candidate division CSSED10-310 bacterium]|uniref:DUF2804 domain-containing protein n=1 Tax=candidate division CSSED10-310 bacterium TaxID=2855610 RepID=A0ABV6Z4V8_UNCC1
MDHKSQEIRLINQQGKPNFGLWTGEIFDVNLQNYQRGGLCSLLKLIREKRWQYVGIYGQKVQIGLAVVDTGYLGNVFCYAYDKEQGRLTEIERNVPLAMGIRCDRNVASGTARFASKSEQVIITNDIFKGERQIQVNLTGKGTDIKIQAALKDDMKSVQPLQIVTPTAEEDFTFTHKSAGLPVSGTLEMNGRLITFDGEKEFGAIDYTFGFPAYHTVWNWASMAGLAEDGTVVGLNLVAPIHHDTFNENCLWIGGQMIKTGPALFEFDSKNTLQDWQIKTADSKVNLTFHPLGKRQQNINAIVISSRFQQPFGFFSGQLRGEDNTVYQLKDVPGVVEDHEAYW